MPRQRHRYSAAQVDVLMYGRPAPVLGMRAMRCYGILRLEALPKIFKDLTEMSEADAGLRDGIAAGVRQCHAAPAEDLRPGRDMYDQVVEEMRSARETRATVPGREACPEEDCRRALKAIESNAYAYHNPDRGAEGEWECRYCAARAPAESGIVHRQVPPCPVLLARKLLAQPRKVQEDNEEPDSEQAHPRLYRDREGRCPAHDADVCEVCPGDTLAAKLSPLELLAEELASQDNAVTAEPLFVVFQKMRVYGLEASYTDLFEWTRDGELVSDDLAESLEAGRKAGCACPEGYARVGYTEVDRFATACLTRKGAENYIRANGRNLRNPVVYVESGHRNEEWIELRRDLAALLAGKKEGPVLKAAGDWRLNEGRPGWRPEPASGEVPLG